MSHRQETDCYSISLINVLEKKGEVYFPFSLVLLIHSFENKKKAEV